ncbi:MAG: YfaZ family outer membrane protein [Campylobacterota bacterium]|nr:YfaZ family outer membrane protein [Campylobacterota bacterium]
MLKKLLFIIATASTLFGFHSAEININDKDFEGRLRFDAGQFNETLMPDSLFFGVGYIKGSEEHSDFPTTDGLVEATFLMQRPIGSNDNIIIGMGVKYEYSRIDDENFSALPLGIELRYLLPFEIAIPLYIGGEFYYSPEVLTFNDAKNYIEYRANIDVEIIDRGHIIVGYRNIELNFDKIDMNYNRSWYFGFKFQF